MIHKFSILAVGLLLSSAASGASLTGTVIYVVDGDTLDFAAPGQKTIRVRLGGVDAPETSQRFGLDSKNALRVLCLGKQASIDTHGNDRYGRTIANVTCNGIDANREQVRTGSAWVYDRYVIDLSLYADQSAARAAHRGLWSDTNPTAPWIFRHSGH